MKHLLLVVTLIPVVCAAICKAPVKNASAVPPTSTPWAPPGHPFRPAYNPLIDPFNPFNPLNPNGYAQQNARRYWEDCDKRRREAEEKARAAHPAGLRHEPHGNVSRQAGLCAADRQALWVVGGMACCAVAYAIAYKCGWFQKKAKKPQAEPAATSSITSQQEQSSAAEQNQDMK
jgi:hypothetical protein